LKQLISCRGANDTTGADPRCVVHESALEEKTTLVALSHPIVADLIDQPPAVSYTDEDGRARRHTFDYLVQLRDGRRVGIAVKPRGQAQRRNLSATLRRIAAQTPPSFAHAVVHVGEDKLPRDLVHNARLFHAVRRDPAAPEDARAAEYMSTLRGETTIGAIVNALGGGGPAFRATVRMIADGILETRRGARIDHGTVVWRADTNPEQNR
jgi:hypothetical protein